MKSLSFYKYKANLKLQNKYIFTICLLFCVMLLNCKKNNLSELDKAAARLSGSSMVSYVEAGSMMSLNGTNYNYVTSYIGVPVTLKAAVNTNDTIFASVDTTLVSVYNQVYQENNPIIPNGAFSIGHDGIFPVAAGAAKSNDSLYVTLRDASRLRNNTTYLIPISLASKNGSELTYSLFFIKMKVMIGQITSRMDMANRWGTGPAPYWRNGSLFITYTFTTGTNGTVVGPDSVRISVALNSAFNPSNLSAYARIAVDDSTINAYSRKVGTTYRALPADTYELRRSVVRIAAGSAKSTDSLSIILKNKQNILRSTWYLVGVKLRSASNDGLGAPPVPTDSATAFVSIFRN